MPTYSILWIFITIMFAIILAQFQFDPEIEWKINDYIHIVCLPAADVCTLSLTVYLNDFPFRIIFYMADIYIFYFYLNYSTTEIPYIPADSTQKI